MAATLSAPTSSVFGRRRRNSSPPYRSDVGNPCRGVLEYGCDAFDAFVAHLMPVSVVILFEIINVGHDQREGLRGALESLVFVLQGLVEVAPIEHAGQFIRIGQEFHFLVRFSQFDFYEMRVQNDQRDHCQYRKHY
jgi:hypothetical protein